LLRLGHGFCSFGLDVILGIAPEFCKEYRPLRGTNLKLSTHPRRSLRLPRAFPLRLSFQTALNRRGARRFWQRDTEETPKLGHFSLR
jgi:hypothetical protein